MGFWLPGDARDFLAAKISTPARIAVREHLHLLLSIIAAEHGDSPTARAIARDPSRIMRTLDSLASAGMELPVDLPAEAKAIASRFFARLRALGWTTVQQLDWQLANEGRSRTPSSSSCIESLLILGFDGLHWELWPLLNATVRASENADVILNQPRYKAEQIDQAWIGSWEQEFGAAESLGAAAMVGRPFASLSEKMENPQAEIRVELPRADVLIGRDLREQSEAIVARAATWLATEKVARLGIIVPAAGPLAREISTRLLQRGITHFDAIGRTATPDDESQQWRAWLGLQREPKLGPLLKVTRTAGPQFEETIESAYGELLTDDLAVIAAWLAASPRETHKQAAKQLSEIALLPATATLAEFIEATRNAITKNNWRELLAQFDEQSQVIGEIGGEKISRSLFLDWLASVTDTASRQRDPRTTNPFAIVQLLPVAHAEGQTWSHLILADLNEGRWPPTFDLPGFLREDEIAAINRDAVETGNQGEGHLAAKSGRALLLGPNERRALARRQFYNLVESPAAAIAVTAALENDEDSRGLGPSDFLSHLYFTQTGEPLTESRAALIQSATQRWLESESEADILPADAGQTRIAFDSRRAEEVPFGEYEFALRSPPSGPLIIACKKWETAIKSPAIVWLAHVLGVEKGTDFLEGDRWPLTTGIWVHAWMRDAIGANPPEKLIRRPDDKTMLAQLRRASSRTRTFAERAFGAANRPLPDWWQSGWARASWIAGELAQRVAEIPDWPFAATEWKLPKPTEIKIGAATLRVSGRMDFVVSHDELFAPGSRLWLFDFKTGADKPLRPKDLFKKFAKGGGGLQLALYALALRAIGAADVAITLLTPETEVEQQLNLADVESLKAFWRGLARMQDTGIFGMRGELRSEFSHVETMPLATLQIGEDLLEEKWALTHPDLIPNDQATMANDEGHGTKDK